METQATGLETMNAVGIGALIVVVLAWIGGFFFAFRKPSPESPKFIWRDPKARREHLIFTGVCFIGVVAALVGFLWGGWPRS